MVGSYMGRVFTVSSQRILTPSNLKGSAGSDWANHEIIGKNGLACDVVVDTQTQQYPIYVFKGKETLTYTDIDAELYDMENTQVDSVRFILWALTDISRIEALRENYAHIEKVYEAALAANASVRYTKVEG